VRKRPSFPGLGGKVGQSKNLVVLQQRVEGCGRKITFPKKEGNERGGKKGITRGGNGDSRVALGGVGVGELANFRGRPT